MRQPPELTRQRARHLRREETDAERKLWTRLRSRKLRGVKFRRQVPIGPFIGDFAAIERKLVVVDEAWKVMRQPSGAEFVEELARSARHYHAGLQLATQDIVEFLRSDFGEPIVKQCDIRILFGQAPEGADALARYFDLTAAERRLLLHARPGEGLLFVGRSHTAFEAVVAPTDYPAPTPPPADISHPPPPATRPPLPP